MKNIKKNIALGIFILLSMPVLAQHPYQNPALTPEERAHDLMKRLTLEEKIGLMMDESKPVKRLGVKEYGWWNEALHGVARAGFATVFPQAIGLGATFNAPMVNRVFTAVSDEARAKYNDFTSRGDHKKYHGLTFWTPTINIFRDPRWGRGQESYGEDPYLTGRMAVAVINGLQGPSDSRYDKLHACAKHFAVHSGPEWNRHSFDARDIAPRDLWETYLPAFEAAVREADVKQVMCAYQRYEGQPCCGSDRLLMKILRRKWDYKHIVVSDCWAINDFFMPGHHETSPDAASAAAEAVLSGTDLECGYIYENLLEAVNEGYIQEAQLNISVERLLKERFAFGEMDDLKLVEWSNIMMDTVNCDTHKQLALNSARESIVLLQNKNNILPLKKNRRKIIVMGPNAVDSVMQWASYNGTPAKTITVLDGIRNTLGYEVPYVRACDLVSNHVFESCYDRIVSATGKRGMTAKYWNGKERKSAPDATEFFSTQVKQDASGATAFAPGIDLREFVAEYEGYYTPAADEEMMFELGGRGCHLYIDGEKLLSPRKAERLFIRRHLKKGQRYHIKVEFIPEPKVKVPFVDFDMGNHVHIPTSIAVDAAKDADIVIFVGGLTRFLEGEEMQVSYDGFKGGDRTSIELPPAQREILQALHEAGKKVIFVNCTGSAVALKPETVSCDAILQAWYPGEAGGQAVADVIFGDYNPGGRLPVTFYESTADLPPFEEYSMANRTYRYFKGQPLFPFGHGLSYTKFKYGKAHLSDGSVSGAKFAVSGSKDKNLTLTVKVKNTGRRAGDEVVQVYLRDMQDADGPLKQLCGFARVNIPAGKTVDVEVPIMNQGLRTYDAEKEDMVVKPGTYEILYGGTSDDSSLQKFQIVIE